MSTTFLEAMAVRATDAAEKREGEVEVSVEEWLKKCPTCWNIEYIEDFGRVAYFIREDNEDIKTFQETFTAAESDDDE